MTNTTQKVILEIENDIAIISLNRPEKLNALNEEIWTTLGEIIDKLEKDKNIRCAILTGKGRAFSSGLDLSIENPLVRYFQIEDKVKAYDNFYKLIKNIQQVYNKIEELYCPVIAAIHGACIGGGLELALCCDIRIAQEDAFFSIPEVRFGLLPDLGGTQRLTKIVGVGLAKELIYTGKRITAEEAFRIKLINKICKNEELMEVALNLAKEIVVNAPLAVTAAKKAINAALNYPQNIGLEYEAYFNAKCLISDDVKEGFSSYFEKRKPNFKGK